jgi:hypothetical protein
MAAVQYESSVEYECKENAGRKFWMGRYSCYAIRIDANRRLPWLITLEGRSVRKRLTPRRAQAAATVSDALDELGRQKS